MERGSLNAQKHTSGEAPKVCSVFGVQYYLFALAWSQPAASRPSQPAASRPSEPEARTQPANDALVDTSVYLKPIELLDVALDVLAGLAPCLNLGVRELGHEDLLDTIGADNCRK